MKINSNKKVWGVMVLILACSYFIYVKTVDQSTSVVDKKSLEISKIKLSKALYKQKTYPLNYSQHQTLVRLFNQCVLESQPEGVFAPFGKDQIRFAFTLMSDDEEVSFYPIATIEGKKVWVGLLDEQKKFVIDSQSSELLHLLESVVGLSQPSE